MTAQVPPLPGESAAGPSYGASPLVGLRRAWRLLCLVEDEWIRLLVIRYLPEDRRP